MGLLIYGPTDLEGMQIKGHCINQRIKVSFPSVGDTVELNGVKTRTIYNQIIRVFYAYSLFPVRIYH